MTSPTITPKDLQTTTSCATVAPYLPNYLKMPTDEKGTKFDATANDEGKHFITETNPITLAVETIAQTNSKRLKFVANAAGRSGNILFLPFFSKNITSIVIPTTDASVCYFTTESLSGCNFFIDQLRNGDLVCLHANAIQFSPTKAELQADAFAINPKAVEAMDTQHTTALKHYPGAKSVYKLRQDEYLKEAKVKAAAKASQGFKDVNFYGGTTVVGFRLGGKWQFWFQTYGHLEYTSGGKKVTTNQERIQAKCFWQQT